MILSLFLKKKKKPLLTVKWSKNLNLKLKRWKIIELHVSIFLDYLLKFIYVF